MHIKSFGFRGLRKLNFNGDNLIPNFNFDAIEKYQPSKINIIVGPNGGGKSTVLDLIRSMSDAGVLRTIARENITKDTLSGFIVHFDNGDYVGAALNQLSIDEYGVHIKSSSGAEFRGGLSKDVSDRMSQNLHDVINSLHIQVEYRSRHDEDESVIPIQVFIDTLNADGKHLTGLAPFPLAEGQHVYKAPPGFHSSYSLKFPIHHIKKDIVTVRFNDDERQGNHVPIGMLPSGWRAFGGLIAWLSIVSDGAICVIEEPETHIHPKLLRVMLQRISELASKKNLQVFMTTHSVTLIDINTWPNSNVKLFEADGSQFRELTAPSLALEKLGVRPSDVCQANGIVWVEGSSDRIYIIHWLKLWCDLYGKKMPIENAEFSFVFYGGSMLNQFSGASRSDLIDIFKINQNSIVVMDCDLDFSADVNDHKIPVNPAGTKARVFNDLMLLSKTSRYCWITQGYTIESYLPLEFRNKYYELKEGRLKAISSLSKVVVAEKFRREFGDFNLSHESGSDLSGWIERLYGAIIAWNE